jgi:hypothetical protein
MNHRRTAPGVPVHTPRLTTIVGKPRSSAAPPDDPTAFLGSGAEIPRDSSRQASIWRTRSIGGRLSCATATVR